MGVEIMFTAKVAFISQPELPEDFWDEVVGATVYHDECDRAYFEMRADTSVKPLKELGILNEEEVKYIIEEEIDYIMMHVFA